MADWRENLITQDEKIAEIVADLARLLGRLLDLLQLLDRGPAQAELLVAEELGGHTPLRGAELRQQTPHHFRGQLVKQIHPVVGRHLLHQLQHLTPRLLHVPGDAEAFKQGHQAVGEEADDGQEDQQAQGDLDPGSGFEQTTGKVLVYADLQSVKPFYDQREPERDVRRVVAVGGIGGPLELELVGTHSNRSAIGAEVTVEFGGVRQRHGLRWCGESCSP